MTDFAADLDLVLSRTGHLRYRDLTDPAHPDHDPHYIPVVRAMAARLRGDSQPAIADPPLPSLATQALSAAGAIARTAAAALSGRRVLVPDDIYEARLAICQGDPSAGRPRCEHYRADGRCGGLGCGCYLMDDTARLEPYGKARLAPLACPLDPPRWGVWAGVTDPETTDA